MKPGYGDRILYAVQESTSQLQGRDAAQLGGNRGPEINIALWVLTCISALFLALRLYCKSYRHKDLWWDDWILIVSWIFLLANSITTTLSVSLGFGKHLLQIPFPDREELLLLGSLSTTFSTLSAVLSKTSFGLTLLRLTQAGYSRTRALVWLVMASMNALMFCDAFYSWVECRPSRKHWDVLAEGTCWAPDVAVRFGIVAGAYSGCMDVVMAVLPWGIIWETRMDPREKVGVLVAMSMGLGAGAAAFAKCSQIPQIALLDETYTGASLVVLGAAEPAITIVGASIPALRVLLTDFKRFTQRRSSEQSESQGSNFDFWDDNTREGPRSLFKWSGFRSSKSGEPSNVTGTASSATTCIGSPAGFADNLWMADPMQNTLTFDSEIFCTSGTDDIRTEDSTPKTSISVPRITRPAPSHNYPNLSQQLEDFLWSRENSFAGTLSDSIYDGDYKPVVEILPRQNKSSRIMKKDFLSGKQNFTTSLELKKIQDDSDQDTWSLGSVLESGQGGKALSLHCGVAPGQFVVVQTTEIAVDFE